MVLKAALPRQAAVDVTLDAMFSIENEMQSNQDSEAVFDGSQVGAPQSMLDRDVTGQKAWRSRAVIYSRHEKTGKIRVIVSLSQISGIKPF